jgi:hypothetical protein
MHNCYLPITDFTLIPLPTLPSRYIIGSIIGVGKEKSIYHVFDNMSNQYLALCISYYNYDSSLTIIRSAQQLKLHNMPDTTFSYPIEYAIIESVPKEIADQVILYDDECSDKYFIFTIELFEKLSIDIYAQYEDMCIEALINYESAQNICGWIHGDWDSSNIMMKKNNKPRNYVYNGKTISINTKYSLIFIDYFAYGDYSMSECTVKNDKKNLLDSLNEFHNYCFLS